MTQAEIESLLSSWSDDIGAIIDHADSLDATIAMLDESSNDLETFLRSSAVATAMASAGLSSQYGDAVDNAYNVTSALNDMYDDIAGVYNIAVLLQDDINNADIHYLEVSTNCLAQSHISSGGGDGGCTCTCHCPDYSDQLAAIQSSLDDIASNVSNCSTTLQDIYNILYSFFGEYVFDDLYNLQAPLYEDYNDMTYNPFGGIDPSSYTAEELDDLTLWQKLNLYLHLALLDGTQSQQPNGDELISRGESDLQSLSDQTTGLISSTTNKVSSSTGAIDTFFNQLGVPSADHNSSWRPPTSTELPSALRLYGGLDVLNMHIPGLQINFSESASSDGVKSWYSQTIVDFCDFVRSICIAFWFALIGFTVINLALQYFPTIIKAVFSVYSFVSDLLNK